MAHIVREQRTPEGPVFASGAVSHSMFPLDHCGYHTSQSAGLLRSSTYDAFGLPLCFTPERRCHPHGDECYTLASPECGVSWPSVFLSPSKLREAAQEVPQLPVSNANMQPLEPDGDRTRLGNKVPLCSSCSCVSLADYSPRHHHQQQDELHREAQKRCRDLPGTASDASSGHAPSMENGACSRLECSANSFSVYRRSLLRLMLEKGRRTFQQRRKRTRHAWNGRGSKLEGETVETSAHSDLSTGCSTRLARSETVDHVQSAEIDKQRPLVFLDGAHSPTNSSSRNLEVIRVDDQLGMTHAHDGLGRCSSAQCVTAEEVLSVNSLRQCPGHEGEKLGGGPAGSSVISDHRVERVQPWPFQTYMREALTEGLDSNSPAPLQDIHLSLPQQDPVQSLAQRQSFQNAGFFTIRREMQQDHLQPTGDTPVQQTQRRKDWIVGFCKEYNSNLTAPHSLCENLASSALCSGSEMRERTTKEFTSTREEETSYLTRVPKKSTNAPEKECRWCATCNEQTTVVAGVPTCCGCVDSQQLCHVNKGSSSSISRLLECSTFSDNVHLLECGSSTVRPGSDAPPLKEGCLCCFCGCEDPGERWYPHACPSNPFHPDHRPGATLPASTACSSSQRSGERDTCPVQPGKEASWKPDHIEHFGSDPSGHHLQKLFPPAVSPVSSARKRPSGRSRFVGTCETEFSGVVHDIKAMRWISQERNKKFDGVRCASITVRDYFYRIAALCRCSCSCHLLALIYMDRLQQSVPNLFFDMLNIHRILLTSIMCAAKFYDDTFLSNAFYAMFGAYLSQLGCISPQNLQTYIQAHEGPEGDFGTLTEKLC